MEEVKEEAKPTMVAEAIAAAERLEKANLELNSLLTRQEIMIAQSKLGGKSEAGSLPVEKKEETPKEYAARVMRGG